VIVKEIDKIERIWIVRADIYTPPGL